MNWNWEFLTSVLQIVVIDAVLSGDNAVVIALAAHRLPRPQRRLAILFGAGGAIGLRVLFTFVLARLLSIPLLRLVGGLVLVWISMKLLLQEQDEEQRVREAASLPQAVWIIMMADFVMSLDNMLAVGGASEGVFLLILFGLFLSIGIIMTCSALIAELMNRFPILVLIGASVLALTAGEMIVEDEKVAESLIVRTATCMDNGWHKHFQSWFGTGTPDVVHRHWIGWAAIGFVILFVVTSPRWWSALRGRRRAAPPAAVSGQQPDRAPAPERPGDSLNSAGKSP